MDGNLMPSFDKIANGQVGGARKKPDTSPYASLDDTKFWRTGVAETNPLIMHGLYRKRFEITQDDWIATAGSCFAQHIAANFRARGFRVLDKERAPASKDPELAKAFGYGVYSARYANIYTVRQLLELLREATAEKPWPVLVWEKDGRYYDALRPGVEPNGLATRREVVVHRAAHLARVRQVFRQTRVFVFTMGLTEAWVDTKAGRTLPTCPGTIAGTFDSSIHAFKNFNYEEIIADYRTFHAELAKFNPGVRHLITVSPVPLTATAADQHVLVATMYSKSVLRAVAGQLYAEFEDLDYFPSYEIIAAHPSRGFFFEGNLRSVSPAGVETVMRTFFDEHAAATSGDPRRARRKAAEDVQCEEALLEAFKP